MQSYLQGKWIKDTLTCGAKGHQIKGLTPSVKDTITSEVIYAYTVFIRSEMILRQAGGMFIAVCLTSVQYICV